MASDMTLRSKDGRGKKRKAGHLANTIGRRTTRSMTLDSTRQAVFQTNELLENILSYVPFKQLFVIQCVSKQWNGVIKTSPSIQEKMFLRLKSAAPRERWILHTDRREPNPFYAEENGKRPLLQLSSGPKFRLIDEVLIATSHLFTPVTLNPELSHLNSRLSAVERLCSFYHEAASFDFRYAAFRKNCSLLDMYITDPPCRRAGCNMTIQYKGAVIHNILSPSDPKSHFQVEAEAGLTIRDVLTAALRWDEAFRRSEDCYSDKVDITLQFSLLEHGTIIPVVPTEAERADVFKKGAFALQAGTADTLGLCLPGS